MGCPLKQALKTLCGVHDWTYAVFWKISCRNSEILFWEEYYCHHETRSDFGMPIHLLLNKMMVDDRVQVTGEDGLVGEAAFTGKHHWIQLGNFLREEAFPPKVLRDLKRQFSAGVQTVAVIPVLPHGVVQFGSHLSLMENMGFVYDVSCLLHQLGFIHGALQSRELSPRLGGIPILSADSSPAMKPSALESEAVLAPFDDPFACTTDQSRDDLFDILDAAGLMRVEKTCFPDQIHSNDDLLDAVVSKTCRSHSLDGGSVSCKTTVKEENSASCSSIHDSNGTVSTMPDNNKTGHHKRIKPGENPRPRPKDRQMIQDRVKELREIVPNGAKCSIDSLLDRTIKHIVFLQNVTKYGNQMKQTSQITESDLRGATWAYEVGFEYTVCPIVVEDQNQPGQMLIKILCREHDLFLEVADVIRGLGFTILKAVMETTREDDNILWACFAVEGDRGIGRMEVSIELLRFIEQNMKRKT